MAFSRTMGSSSWVRSSPAGPRARSAHASPAAAATNMKETLDPALLRPGRFDRMISVRAPSRKGREDLLRHYLAKVTADSRAC